MKCATLNDGQTKGRTDKLNLISQITRQIWNPQHNEPNKVSKCR